MGVDLTAGIVRILNPGGTIAGSGEMTADREIHDNGEKRAVYRVFLHLWYSFTGSTAVRRK